MDSYDDRDIVHELKTLNTTLKTICDCQIETKNALKYMMELIIKEEESRQ